MKVLFQALNYAPEQVGTGKYSADMAEWLAGRGHEVDVIAAPPHYPEWRIDPEYHERGYREEEVRGVRVLRTPVFLRDRAQVGALDRIVLESSYNLASLRYWLPIMVGRKRYDVVVAVCPPLQSALLPAANCTLRGTPWVLHVQDLQVDAAYRLGLLRGHTTARLLFRSENYLLRSATAVSTITDSMRSRIHAKGVPFQRTWLVPNWADLSEVMPQHGKNHFRAHVLGASSDDVIVMYAGNLGEKQGLELLVDVAARLRERREIRWVLIGNGAAAQRLKQGVSRRGLTNIRFLPPQPRERLGEVLGAADIHLVVQKVQASDLVMPSKLTNIFAAGRSCVVTAIPGTALYETVTSANAGLIVPPGDGAAMAKAVVSLASNRRLRSLMGGNARAYAEAHMDKNVILQDLEQRLATVAGRSCVNR